MLIENKQDGYGSNSHSKWPRNGRELITNELTTIVTKTTKTSNTIIFIKVSRQTIN